MPTAAEYCSPKFKSIVQHVVATGSWPRPGIKSWCCRKSKPLRHHRKAVHKFVDTRTNVVPLSQHWREYIGVKSLGFPRSKFQVHIRPIDATDVVDMSPTLQIRFLFFPQQSICHSPDRHIDNVCKLDVPFLVSFEQQFKFALVRLPRFDHAPQGQSQFFIEFRFFKTNRIKFT